MTTHGNNPVGRLRAPLLAGIALAFVLGAFARPGVAQGTDADAIAWSAQLRTTGYLFQSIAPGEEAEDRFGFYEHFDLGAGRLLNDRLDFRISGRFANDLAMDGGVANDARERLYSAYATMDFDRWHTRARVGRQFLVEGTTRLTLDGGWISLRPAKRWEVHGWVGALAPSTRLFEPGDFGDDGATGVRVVGKLHRRLRVGAWWAYHERGGIAAAQPFGGEMTIYPTRGVRAILRGAYDSESEEMQRIDALAQIKPWDELPMLEIQYVDRVPSVEADSYFSRFADEFERIRLLRATMRYERENGWGAEGEVFGGFVDERDSGRWGLALLGPHLRVGYSFRTGDGGDEDRWYGDVNAWALPWLHVSAGAVYSEYALLEQPEEGDLRELVTAFGRARAQLREGVKLLLEVQSLDNPFYNEDVRLLVGLDLGAGRGPSSFGYGRGGWLQ